MPSKMSRDTKTSCDVCGRGTDQSYARHIPAHRLDEPNSYTICTRADCDSLSDAIDLWLRDNEDVDWFTFDELLETIDGCDKAKQKFTPKWERTYSGAPIGDPTHITDYTEASKRE